MAGHDAARLPGHAEPKASLSTPDTRPRPSFETEQSSTSGGNRRQAASSAPASSHEANTGRQDRQQTGPSPAQIDSATGFLQREASARRKDKPNSSGGFLLRNPFAGKLRRPGTRGSIRTLFQANGKPSTHPQTPQSSRSHDDTILQSKTSPGRYSYDKTRVSPQSNAGRGEGSEQGGGGNRGSEEQSMTRRFPRISGESMDDVDSTQIVQMALNLSESRRIASRRYVSRATPPRLSTLPDGDLGGNLQQHLQQQRKVSSNGSPKPPQGASPRVPSSGRLDGSLLGAGFQSAHDGHYRYQFSSSTLARAAKAKEHLELMAQYRRLLAVLPPLKAESGPHATTSPPGSPGSANRGDSLPLGRQYNPLQFIRNRKVRARERKVIDGEKQGFGDVELVKLWVDRVVERATSHAMNADVEVDCVMPNYPEADDSGIHTPMDHLSRPSTRVRRPRVDWFIEPCDIMADAYWLEQEDHKELIEDRHWRRIFPPAATSSRPISRDTVLDLDVIPTFSMQDDDLLDSQISGISQADDNNPSHNSAKERAKQTLHNIRSFPHRHQGQKIHADSMWHKKDSASDVSGSETDRSRKRAKKPPAQESDIGASSNDMSKDLTMQQISDMVATDVRRRDHMSGARSDPESGHFVSSANIRKSDWNTLSLPPSVSHSRQESTRDASESDRKPVAETLASELKARYVPGRQSLDVPRKDFSGNELSRPTSPDLRPTRESTETVVSGRLAPSWSRSASPHRNPISKLKQIIRDKGGNNKAGGADQEVYRREPALEHSSSGNLDTHEDHQATGVEQVHLEPVKSHRRVGSSLLRSDDAAGPRGIFRAGPRLDTVFRGGVAKLGDMLWKRDGVSEQPPPEIEITDESENDKDGTRSKPSMNVSRRSSEHGVNGQDRPKPFLDIIPQFHHAHAGADQSSSANESKVDLTPASPTTHNNASAQLGTLHQPQIDAKSASNSARGENRSIETAGDLFEPPRQGNSSNAHDAARDADKLPNSMLQVSRPEDDAAGSTRSRHWSIADIQGTPTGDTRLTRREVARMRALVLSTGIKAMEITRRAQEAQKPFCSNDALSSTDAPIMPSAKRANLNWTTIGKLYPEATTTHPSNGLQGPASHIQIAFYELYAFAGRSLSAAIEKSGRRWQASAEHFTFATRPQLLNRIGDVRSRIADDLSEQSRQASDLADETNRDLALVQPLKVKAVVDTIGKMLRRRRRRLRWIRRALWLTVEWLLVGIMWYVWAMVMILRVFLGVGKGVVRSVRWLLWL
ncbi:hypothetical protein E4U56_004927 [Claviceps arundinis]|uniref:Uncharacterized protein n=1 Tax=Claviceps arundinis TaxID=1623583 RepID=A0A9P7STE3_9HYPO|nr:hypothetical protein E4U56_004927 [Claviceps arundinis]